MPDRVRPNVFRKPAGMPLPMLAATVFVVLAIGTQYAVTQTEEAPYVPPPPTVYSVSDLFDLADGGSMDPGVDYSVSDQIFNLTFTSIMGIIYNSHFKFDSLRGTTFDMYGNYSYLHEGDYIRGIAVYQNQHPHLLFLNITKA
jgi:hypothetical protein